MIVFFFETFFVVCSKLLNICNNLLIFLDIDSFENYVLENIELCTCWSTLYFTDWKKGYLCFFCLSFFLDDQRDFTTHKVLLPCLLLCCWSLFLSQFSRWRGKSLLCPNKVKTKGYNTHPSLCAQSCIPKSSFKQKIQPRRKGSI